MARTIGTQYTLTIPINESESNRLRFGDEAEFEAGMQLPAALAIIAPDVAFTNTIKIRAGTNTAEGILESGGADIEIRRGRVVPITLIPGLRWIEIISVDGSDVPTAEAAARAFTVTLLVED